MAKKRDLIKVEPTKAELTVIKKDAETFINRHSEIIVASAEHVELAYNVLKGIKEKKNVIEKKRTDITGPLNAALRATNAMFKEIVQPLKVADLVIRGKVTAYLNDCEEKAWKKDEARAKIQQSHADRGHKTTELAPTIVEPTAAVTQKRWVYEIIDAAKVPRKLLCPDERKIKAAIDEGERQIPGLKIFQKRSLSVRG